MKASLGNTGLVLNEPLLWEKGKQGRSGLSLPRSDVAVSPLAQDVAGQGPDLPDLSEVDVVRHYTRLSQWNFGVDTGMYPLGSCTMKYNPKINEKMANLPGFAAAHPLLPGAHPHPKLPGDAFSRRRRPAADVLAHPRSLRGARRLRGGDGAHPSGHRHLPRHRA